MAAYGEAGDEEVVYDARQALDAGDMDDEQADDAEDGAEDAGEDVDAASFPEDDFQDDQMPGAFLT